MSTGAECNFTEVEPGKWQYRLQRWPYGDSPDYDKYGPFPSFKQAREHLNENHANPGGWSVDTHPDHIHEWTLHQNMGFIVRVMECDACGKERSE